MEGSYNWLQLFAAARLLRMDDLVDMVVQVFQRCLRQLEARCFFAAKETCAHDGGTWAVDAVDCRERARAALHRQGTSLRQDLPQCSAAGSLRRLPRPLLLQRQGQLPSLSV